MTTPKSCCGKSGQGCVWYGTLFPPRTIDKELTIQIQRVASKMLVWREIGAALHLRQSSCRERSHRSPLLMPYVIALVCLPPYACCFPRIQLMRLKVRDLRAPVPVTVQKQRTPLQVAISALAGRDQLVGCALHSRQLYCS